MNDQRKSKPEGGDDEITDPARVVERTQDEPTERAPVSSLLGPRALGDELPCLLVLTGPDVGKVFKLETTEAVLGRSAGCTFRLEGAGISRNHATVSSHERGIVIKDLGSSNGTLVNGRQIYRAELKEGDKVQLGPSTVLKFTYYDAVDEQFQQNMLEAVQRDPLTKLYNKRYLLRHLESELAYSKRHKTDLAVLFFDIDHFKSINDDHGHVAGDTVLVDLARTVTSALRTEDVLARYGGEEFAIVCRGIPLDGVLRLAERIRSAIEAHAFGHEGEAIPVTISVGVATAKIDQTPTDLLDAADRALYAAKGAGRNQVKLESDG